MQLRFSHQFRSSFLIRATLSLASFSFMVPLSSGRSQKADLSWHNLWYQKRERESDHCEKHERSVFGKSLAGYFNNSQQLNSHWHQSHFRRLTKFNSTREDTTQQPNSIHQKESKDFVS